LTGVVNITRQATHEANDKCRDQKKGGVAEHICYCTRCPSGSGAD